jgi:hypothetical protein
MSKAYYALALALLWPMLASAQPVFRDEHDWTAHVAGRLYGVRQIAQFPGGSRTTQVWLGRLSFQVKGTVADLFVQTMVSPVSSLPQVEWWSVRWWP